MRRVRFAQATTLAIVVLGFVFSVALNWPGHLSYDSVVQLHEGRTGVYGNWHPPVMSWLLGVFDALIPGTGVFVFFDSLLLYGALGWAASLRGGSWAGAAVALAFVFTPQFLLYPGIVWKDVLFAAAAIAAFVSIGQAARIWESRPQRFLFIAVAWGFLALAALTRQNGAIVLPFGALALATTSFQRNSPAPILNAIFYGAGSLGILLIVVACAYFGLHARVVPGTGPAGQFRLLDTYDLAGALAADRKLDLGILDDDEPQLAVLMRSTAARLYTPERNDTLASSAPLQRALLNADENSIPAQWRAFVREHPLLYLRLRWEAFRWVLLTPDPLACRPIFAGITGPEPLRKTLALPLRFDWRDLWLTNYGLAFAGTPVLSHATFLALAFAVLLILVRRRSVADLAMASMLISAIAFTSTFFVISIACDYRYLYFLDVSAMVALLYVCADPMAWHNVGVRLQRVRERFRVRK